MKPDKDTRYGWAKGQVRIVKKPTAKVDPSAVKKVVKK